MPLQGTAVSRSIFGELGDWSRLELMVGSALGVKPPKTREENEWRTAQQERLKRIQDSQKRSTNS